MIKSRKRSGRKQPSRVHGNKKKLIDNQLKKAEDFSLTFGESCMAFLAASVFSLQYYVVPTWLSVAGAMLIAKPFSLWTAGLWVPVLISAAVPPKAYTSILKSKPFQLIPKYFQYTEVLETSHEEMTKLVEERPTLICLHPHGVFSMVALCSAARWCHGWWDPSRTPTAVADSVLHVPLLKHIVGILGITSASGKHLIKTLNSEENRGCILYPGGTSELFLANPDRERLHLLDRKGFVRIGLTQGCALVPGYLFGNTRVLRLLQWPILRYISRKTGIAITYFFGRFFLPMPLAEPCMCVIGKPILLPKIESPTKDEIDHWHQVYVSELVRIFDTYKVRIDSYKDKTLELE